MKWTKLKHTIEDHFADCIKGRVQLYVTRYTVASFYMVRGWITVDGKEIANFSTPDNFNKFGWYPPDVNNRIPLEERTENTYVEKGEFSRWDFLDACWDYINLNIDEAIISENPIIKSFAVLDKRFGKRRIKNLEAESLHPLVKKLFEIRLEGEKMDSTLHEKL